ncbi:MAG: BMP family ABC transporter substrate-binding protein [Anaerotruncus sp.]|nr:BMP family ABC transporter substrate-binding protein [Anaerotruncus sp.]
MKNKVIALLMAAAMLVATGCSATPDTPASSAAPAPAASSEASSETPSEAPDEQAEEPLDDWSAKTGATTFPAIAKEDIKAGFVYVGDVGDMGYSYAHDQGRQSMIANLGLDESQVLVVTNVPEDSTCEDQLRNLIDQGCNIIFTTSFGHMEWTANVAQEFPDVHFMHCSGYTTGENMSAYFGRMYEARYLSGIVAGMKAKEIGNPKLGYVAAMPIPEVVRGANAFALGVKAAYPEATVEVKFTNTWYDPAVEKQVAMELLNSGCGVLGQHCDTTAPQVAAQEKGGFAVGYNAATYDAAPQAYLTSPLWDWGVYYTKQVQDAIDGKWASSNYWGEMKDGIVSLDALSPNCPEGSQAAVDEAKAKLDDGSLQVFGGPLKDNQGNEKVAQGVVMTDAEMLAFDWFVDNVIGSVPQA